MITHMHNFNKKKKWALSAFITPKKKKNSMFVWFGTLMRV